MLRRASVLLLLALTACQPAPGVTKPVGGQAPGAPSAAPSTDAPLAGTLHGTVQGLRPDVAAAVGYRLQAVLPLVPIAGAKVVQLDAQGHELGAPATTSADGGFDLVTVTGAAWLEARYDDGGKPRALLGPLEPNGTVSPLTSLVVRKARAMLALGAIAAMPSPSDVRGIATALGSAMTAVAAASAAGGNDIAAARAFDTTLASSQAATNAAKQLAFAARTPQQQLTTALVAGTATVSTLAGGTLTVTDGPGATAQYLAPAGVARDAAGNVYVADTGAHVIRKTSPDGSVKTLAGTGLAGFADGPPGTAQLNGPTAVAVDKDGNLYVADAGNHAIRKVTPDGGVTTVAGTGATGFRDGPAAAAAFTNPQGVAVARDGTVYVADTGNHRVRKIATDGTVSTLAGDGTAGNTDGRGGRLNAPRGLAADTNRVLVADTGNNRVRAVALDGTLSTVAGNGAGNTDAVASQAQFNGPSAVALTVSGELLVADTNNNAIRRITAGGNVSTAVQAGSAEMPTTGPVRPLGVAVADDGTIFVADTGANRVGVKRTAAYATFSGTVTSPRREGKGDQALFWKPGGIARDLKGNLYVADTGNDRIRKVTPDGTVSTFAGNGTGDADGPADIAKFRAPTALAFDFNGNLYVVETDARRIRKIDMSKPGTPMVSTLAGDPTAKAEWLEGKGKGAHFDAPRGIAFGPDDKLYVADSGNHRIRTVTLDGATSTFSGTDAAGTADGSLTSAIFDQPTALAFGADGSLYVSDARAQRIRKLTRFNQVSTVAGHATGDADGQALQAAFNDPAGLAVDAAGTIYLADAGNHRIRKITADGAVSTLAGTGLAGWLDGAGSLARFSEPRGVVLGAKGELYVVEAGSSRLRVVTP